MRSVLLLTGLLGCGQPPSLGPSLDPSSAALLRQAPASATLLLGGDGVALRASPWVVAAPRGAEALEALVAQTGLGEDLPADDFVGACDARGCAVMLAGAQPVDAAAVVARAAPHLRRARGLSGAMPGLKGRLRLMDREVPVQLRVDAAGQRAVLGHAGAVSAMLAAEDREPRLDPARLAGRVPAGDLWLYAEDQDRMAAQIAAWLEAQDTPASTRTLEELQAARARLPALAARVVALGVGADLSDEAPALRLRLTCEGEAHAIAVAATLRALLAAQPDPEPPLLDLALAQTTVTRVGASVEVALLPSPDALAEALTP